MESVGDIGALSFGRALQDLIDAGYADEPCVFEIEIIPGPNVGFGLAFPSNPEAQAVYDSITPDRDKG